MKIRKLFLHPGRRVRGAPLPWICDDCERGSHARRGDHGISPACQCACARPLAIEAPRRERPSWWERVSGGMSALIGATAQGLARLIDGGEDHPEDVPRPGDSAGRSAEAPGLATMPGVQPGPGHTQQCGNSPYEIRASDTEPPETQVMGAVKVGDTYLASPQTGTPIGPWCTCIIGSDEGRARTGVRDCPVHGTLPPEDDGDRTEQIGKIRFSGHHQARNIWGPPEPETRWDYLARTGIPDSLAYVQRALSAPLAQVKALTVA